MLDRIDLLVVIDAQIGFLKTLKNRETIIKNIESLIDISNQVIVSRFINPKESFWRINGWSGMDEDSVDILLDIKINNSSTLFIEKSNYSVGKAYNIPEGNGREVYIVGLDTDACVYMTAIDFFEKGWDVKIVADACGSSGGQYLHEFALNLLERNAFADIIRRF